MLARTIRVMMLHGIASTRRIGRQAPWRCHAGRNRSGQRVASAAPKARAGDGLDVRCLPGDSSGSSIVLCKGVRTHAAKRFDPFGVGAIGGCKYRGDAPAYLMTALRAEVGAAISAEVGHATWLGSGPPFRAEVGDTIRGGTSQASAAMAASMCSMGGAMSQAVLPIPGKTTKRTC